MQVEHICIIVFHIQGANKRYTVREVEEVLAFL